MEVFIDGEFLLNLSPKEMTPPEAIPVGIRTLSLRNSGALEVLAQKEFKMGEQPYLIAFIKSADGQGVDFWSVDQPAPLSAQGEVPVEVVNMDTDDYSYDVYAGEKLLASNLGKRSFSDFTNIPAQKIEVKVFNAGQDSQSTRPITSELISFGGGTTMLLLQTLEGELEISAIIAE